ncbi:MAG: hypothetical protein SOZ39_06030 [Desulfovibrio piger]|uniref:hypothetical protein n=1 Tax=Desulfovibrio piger TaxID=901 RepID=UPI002A80BA73|nr:hypothetical protein [Desulfovibrio piger]MDY3880681.1 hypothetical protein [Desulfovibrio piger]
MALEKFFTIFFIIFCRVAVRIPQWGGIGLVPGTDFQAPGEFPVSVFAQAAIYFVFPGADVKLSKTVWALPFLAMSGYGFITTV